MEQAGKRQLGKHILSSLTTVLPSDMAAVSVLPWEIKKRGRDLPLGRLDLEDEFEEARQAVGVPQRHSVLGPGYPGPQAFEFRT